MIASTKRNASVVTASVLGFVGLLAWAPPASAAAVGETASCTFPMTTTAQCNFPVLSATFNAAGNRPSVAGIANAGAIVDIHVKANTTSEILIGSSVVPTGTTTCTASLTATF
jgi:hypothetical protein